MSPQACSTLCCGCAALVLKFGCGGQGSTCVCLHPSLAHLDDCRAALVRNADNFPKIATKLVEAAAGRGITLNFDECIAALTRFDGDVGSAARWLTKRPGAKGAWPRGCMPPMRRNYDVGASARGRAVRLLSLWDAAFSTPCSCGASAARQRVRWVHRLCIDRVNGLQPRRWRAWTCLACFILVVLHGGAASRRNLLRRGGSSRFRPRLRLLRAVDQLRRRLRQRRPASTAGRGRRLKRARRSPCESGGGQRRRA